MKIDSTRNIFSNGGWRCCTCNGAGKVSHSWRPGQTSIPEEATIYGRECPSCLGAGVVYLYKEKPDYSREQKEDSSFLLKEIRLLQKKVKKLTEDKLKLVTHINNLNRK